VGFPFDDCWVILNKKVHDFQLILCKEQLYAKFAKANQFISAVDYDQAYTWTIHDKNPCFIWRARYFSLFPVNNNHDFGER